MSLTASQQQSLQQLIEEECSVIEILQELRSAGQTPEQAREALIGAIRQLAAEGQIEFFVDEFAAASTRAISSDEALAQLEDTATWDMHNATQLHVAKVEP